MDLRLPLPSMAEMMANGGRLLVIHCLREMPYADYLQTNHWQTVRRAAFAHHGRRCLICLKQHGLDIHHVTYDNRGCEPPEDTVPLCREHHKLQHEVLRHVLHAEFERRFTP